MGSKNFVTAGGRVVPVDDAGTGGPTDDAPSSQVFTDADESERRTEDQRHEKYGGVAATIASAGAGMLDTATFGGFGKLVGAIGGDSEAEEYSDVAKEHPIARGAGELASFLAPTGLLGDAAKGVGELTGIGLASSAGRVVGGAGGRLLEGALVGAGAHIADTNATGDPLTIEGLVEGAGVGAVINYGAGLLGDTLVSGGRRAQAAVDEATQARLDSEVATARSSLYDKDSAVSTAYNEFLDSVSANQKSAAAEVRAYQARADKYSDFLSDNRKFKSAVEDAQNVVRSVRGRYSELPAIAEAAPQVAERTPFDVSDVETPGAAPASDGLIQNVEGQPRGALTGYDSTGKPTQIYVNSKPPISAELDGRLRDFNDRISRIWKLRGGGVNPDVAGRWLKDPAFTANPTGAMDELRGLYSDLQSGESGFPKATMKLRPLPEAPGAVPPITKAVDLPNNFTAFLRMRPETIARLANDLGDKTAAEFQKVAVELGYPPTGTAENLAASPGDVIASVHASAGRDLAAIGRASEADAKKAGGFMAVARKFAKNSAAFKVSWMAAHAIGGPIGSAAGVAVSAAARAAMSGTENALIGGAMVSAKGTVRQRISEVIAKYAGPAGRRATKLGPVTAYLAMAFPHGKPDHEPDMRKRALNRLNDVHSAALTAPDAAYSAVQPFMGHPSDTAAKIHQQVMNAVGHLKTTAALDPGLNVKMFESAWTPSLQDSIALAHRLEAVHAPLDALARQMTGDGHPAGAATLWAVWPALMQEATGQIVATIPDHKWTNSNAGAMSSVFGTPMTGLQDPSISLALQAMYLPQPTQPQSSPSPRGGGPTGRPPAVNNPVAGSSVTNLIS